MAANFKQATKQRLRIMTDRGELTVEQLWDLSLEELDTIAVRLDEEYESSGTKSFIKKGNTKKDRDLKLSRDIVVDVIETKIKDNEAAATALDDKKHNEYILGLIEKKKHGEIEDMSVEELEGLLRK